MVGCTVLKAATDALIVVADALTVVTGALTVVTDALTVVTDAGVSRCSGHETLQSLGQPATVSDLTAVRLLPQHARGRVTCHNNEI